MEKKKRIKTNREHDEYIISQIQKQPFIFRPDLPGHYDKSKRTSVFNAITAQIDDGKYN